MVTSVNPHARPARRLAIASLAPTCRRLLAHLALRLERLLLRRSRLLLACSGLLHLQAICRGQWVGWGWPSLRRASSSAQEGARVQHSRRLQLGTAQCFKASPAPVCCATTPAQRTLGGLSLCRCLLQTNRAPGEKCKVGMCGAEHCAACHRTAAHRCPPQRSVTPLPAHLRAPAALPPATPPTPPAHLHLGRLGQLLLLDLLARQALHLFFSCMGTGTGSLGSRS